jgi:RNA polymerase sigma-70 factor
MQSGRVQPADSRTEPTGREVFEILVRDHTAMLLGYLRSLVWSPDAVDDLYQETMLTAWRRLGDYDRERPFGPWVRGIAARLVMKHRERLGRAAVPCEPAVLEALERRFDAAADSADRFAGTTDALADCVRQLPDRLRAAIGAVYTQGMRLREAAAAATITEEAVKKRVQRGRQLLAECLRRAGVLA